MIIISKWGQCEYLQCTLYGVWLLGLLEGVMSQKMVNRLICGVAYVLLVPSAMMYLMWTMSWFVFFWKFIWVTFVQHNHRFAWDQMFFGLKFTVLMVSAGAAIYAIRTMIGIGWSGGTFKHVSKWLWGMLSGGWLSVLLFILWDIRMGERLIGLFPFLWLIGIGPLLSSLLIIVRLYDLGKSQKP